MLLQRTTVQLVAAVTRYTPQKVAPVLNGLVPRVLQACVKEDAELREGSLQALEAFVLKCPSEIPPFLGSIIGLSVQLIKYDPVSKLHKYFTSIEYNGTNYQNYAAEDADEEDEDEQMDDVNDDEDVDLEE